MPSETLAPGKISLTTNNEDYANYEYIISYKTNEKIYEAIVI